jgi:hypothetical protein
MIAQSASFTQTGTGHTIFWVAIALIAIAVIVIITLYSRRGDQEARLRRNVQHNERHVRTIVSQPKSFAESSNIEQPATHQKLDSTD